MATKLKLVPDPTFTAPVKVPVPGKGEVEVTFTFKHRDREAMRAFVERVNLPDGAEGALTDPELVQECASGWELADTFSDANVKVFCREYIAGPAAVFETYVHEMSGARLKNFAGPRR